MDAYQEHRLGRISNSSPQRDVCFALYTQGKGCIVCPIDWPFSIQSTTGKERRGRSGSRMNVVRQGKAKERNNCERAVGPECVGFPGRGESGAWEGSLGRERGKDGMV